MLYAQPSNICGTEQATTLLKATNPNYTLEAQAYETAYQNAVHQRPNYSRNKAIYVLPIVIHIVHDCEAIGANANPDDATIQQMIERTNARFQHSHDGAGTYDNPNYGVDTEISFCLATTDPEGNYTNGILRHEDADNNRGESAVLAQTFTDTYRWNTANYINIFLVKETDVAGVYLGGSERDFIIINASSFWDGLLAHELGHYFSLKHIFSPDAEDTCDGNEDCLTNGDFVCDTPPKNISGLNGGTCSLPANSCTSDENDVSSNNPYRPISMGGLGDQPDMVANYMDYTGSCWDAFTEGQKQRMHFNIINRRMELSLTSLANCQASLPEYEVAIIASQLEQLSCSNDWLPSITLVNNGQNSVQSIEVEIMVEEQVYEFSPSFDLAPATSATIELSIVQLPIGSQNVEITISNPNGSRDAYDNNNHYCQLIQVVGDKGQSALVKELFEDCQLPRSFKITNASSVAWNSGQAEAQLGDCHACFAVVQAFADEAQSASLCLPKMDMSEYETASLSLAIGYIPRYTFITNTLNIYASSNCGTPDLIYSAGGLSLATNTPPAYSDDEMLELATCESIKTIELDLKKYVGQTNVEICIEAEGRWFSPLIIDDIVVSSALSNEENMPDEEEMPDEEDMPNQEDMPDDMDDCQVVEFTKESSICAGQIVEGYTSTGVYRDTFQLANGCDSIRTLTLSVSSGRQVTTEQHTICEGMTYKGHNKKGSYVDVFTATNGCDSISILDLIISPTTTTTFNETICVGENFEGYTTQGTHIDSLQTKNGCDSLRILKLTVIDCTTTSIYDTEMSALLHLFPNPASEHLYINWEGTENLNYAIYSVTGVQMKEGQLTSPKQIIDLATWSAGLYLVHFQSKKGFFTKKVFVE